MRRILLVVLAAALSAGCSERQEATPYIRISPEIRTRATGLHFDTGDRIGLTIVRQGQPYVSNCLLTYDGTAFTAPDLLWYDNLNDVSTLTAYFPYSESGMPSRFTITADQRGGCAPADLLGAVSKNVTPSSTPVGMVFYHLMSQLTIVVTNNSSAKVSGVAIGGFAPVAEVDFPNLSASAKSDAAAVEVEAFCVTENAAYRAILVPQRAALTVRVATDNGKQHTKTISEAALESGKRYDLSITVTDIDIALSLSGEINDWLDGGTIGEDGGGEDGESIAYDGETYRTTVIGGRKWMAENLRYRPAGAVVGTGLWYPAGGAQAVDTQGMLYDYAVATGSATPATPPVRGICPEGWHIPTAEELATLIGAERGSDFFCCAGFWIVANDNHGNANKGYLMGSTASGGKFDCLTYTTAGGEPTAATLAVGGYGVSLRCVKD